MKKIFSLLVLMFAFCIVGFAQSAKPSKKAMLMGDNQIKDLKTGQVLRVTKASKSIPATTGRLTIKKNAKPQPKKLEKTTAPKN